MNYNNRQPVQQKQPISKFEYIMDSYGDTIATTVMIGLGILVVGGLIVASAYGIPKYNVWRAEQHGKGQYVQAEQNRKITVLEAEAKLEAAKALAAAEVERARGVAQANEIIGQSLKDNESYLRWLWIENLDKGNSVIYVPTEAGLPILEAGKR